ncbi:hypothetical protein [Pseudomonas syringae]|uniref:hypothetical protein n=1 Tax=Pseudomonas syringae TaxID=317 RepID=UPI001F172395|nr:hypothetical protein [Pseudomonas syringae]MCF5371966.1 hypothetical protein [Pseudomonas syringae]MCF5382037.1 hypothetical protein [Pseudomonas syringae]MCF5419429.1 hypothetical protein [Pseudomonas syringae]MCF5451976.1 hypothetical protein [Pseudomonas syringae]MCF5460754.1 hypothetical protein [Pseudomonas syringae]
MLPSHLTRMISLCINGDYEDPAVRERIKLQCIPLLSQHRREVLSGTFKGRHCRPAGFIVKMAEKVRLIRRTLAHAHRDLIISESGTNVISFQAAAQRRANSLVPCARYN